MKSEDRERLRELYAEMPPALQRIGEWRLEALAKLRPKQIPPAGDWNVMLAMAGRGWGKTRFISIDAIWRAVKEPGTRLCLVAPTYADARKTNLEGESGIVSLCPDEFLEGGRTAAYNKSLLQLRFANGSLLECHSAEQPDRLRGPQYHHAYCDELAAWPYIDDVWSNLMFGLRLGAHPRVLIATTPRPLKFLKALEKRDDVIVVRGSTFENEDNLAPAALQAMRDQYDGTRVGRQELYGEIINETAGALWQFDWFKRAHEVEDLDEIVIAVDPSGGKGGDAVGIILAGRKGREFYVMSDKSGQYSPQEWAQTVVRLYDDSQADRVLVETNFGGDMCQSVLETEAIDMKRRGERASSEIVIRKVTASRGKVLRAEPVAALYEQQRVYHAASLAELEDEMCSFTRNWDRAKHGSPNRVDALVFALTSLTEGQSVYDRSMRMGIVDLGGRI